MSKFSHFAVKKLHVKRSFNNISGNRSLLLSQINLDQAYFRAFCPGVVRHGGFVQGLLYGGSCPELFKPLQHPENFTPNSINIRNTKIVANANICM